MKKKTTSTKKRLSGQRYLIWGLALVCVFGIAFFSRQSSVIDAEREGFMKLKQDFLSLQAEFNKIDPGWEYGEGCHGRGGVYEQSIPSYCFNELFLKNKNEESVKTIYQSILNNELFISKFSARYTSLNSDKFVSNSYNLSNCSSQLRLNGNTSYINISCSAPASEFYFTRTDK